MTSPLAIVFGKHQTHGRPDLDQPDGCDHDQNVYHYRLVDGAMVLRGIALGPRWESRPMDWRGLSCYKRKEVKQVGVTREVPSRDELLKVYEDCQYSPYRVSKHYSAGFNTIKKWLVMREIADKHGNPLETIKPMSVVEATPVAINDNPQRKTCAACGEVYSWGTGGSWVTEGNVKKWFCENCGVLRIPKPQVICTECARPIDGTVFDNGNGPRCFGCMMGHKDRPGETYATAPIGVEVPQYEPSDNDYIPEDEPIPYVATPSPLDAQIDVMLDALWSEKRAKLKAHLKPLLADAEAWEMVKCIVSRGLA